MEIARYHGELGVLQHPHPLQIANPNSMCIIMHARDIKPENENSAGPGAVKAWLRHSPLRADRKCACGSARGFSITTESESGLNSDEWRGDLKIEDTARNVLEVRKQLVEAG